MKKLFKSLIYLVGCLALLVMFARFFMWVGRLDAGKPGPDLSSGRVVAVVPLKGQILSADDFRKQLQERVKDDKVKGIVVDIDSPGGAVGASEEIFRLIRRADEKKPVVAFLSNMAASGGLYAAVGARKVITHAGTLTGSLGVIFMSPNVTELGSRVGVDMLVVKSGALKDAGSPFRKATNADVQYLQSIVEQAHAQFQSTVREARKLNDEQLRAIADGRIVLGAEAVRIGLADEIGDLHTAAQRTLELAGISGEAELLLPEKPSKLEAFLEGALRWGSVLSGRDGASATGLYYLAWP